VTEQLDRRADATRLQILRAASHQFAHNSYGLVSLDDILAEAEVTKGAMYFHFRSKHALALAIIEQQSTTGREAINELLARKLSALETLIDISLLVATQDIVDDVARAGLHLLESIGRTDGVQASVLGGWIQAFAVVVQRAINEGDVMAERDPEVVGRLMVSMYMGIRQNSDLDDPAELFTNLEKAWVLMLPGFANPDRIAYLEQFLRRRTALAIKNATPPQPDVL
jgi:AcrR family transcriptional regulator